MSTAAHAAAVLLGIASPQDAPIAAPATQPQAAGSTAPGNGSGPATNGAVAGSGAPPADDQSAAPPASNADDWHFFLAGYLWLPGIHGTVGIKGTSVNINDSVGDTVDHLGDLQMALTAHFEAHKGDLGLIFDGMYMSFSTNATGPTVGKYRTTSQQGIFELAASWRLYGERRTIIGPALLVEAIGGARTWTMSGSIKANSVGINVSDETAWVDGFGGLRGAISTGTPWVFLGRFDAGAGGSKFTWNALAAVEYNFDSTFSLDAGWRWLAVDHDFGRNGLGTYDVVMSGPFIALGLRF